MNRPTKATIPSSDGGSDTALSETKGLGGGHLFTVITGVLGVMVATAVTGAVFYHVFVPSSSPVALPDAAPPAPVFPAPPAGPSPEAEALEHARATIHDLEQKVEDLEIRILALKGRIETMAPADAQRLVDRLLSGDPASASSARSILERRGGAIGGVLADTVLSMAERIRRLEARVAVEEQKASEAVRALVAAKQRAETEAEKRDRRKAQAYYELGLKAQQEGHATLAEENYGRALEIDPGFVGALNGRGRVRMDLGRPEDALADFSLASSLRPEYAPLHFNRGRALMSLERHEEAVRAFERVLALDPGHTRALKARDEARRFLREKKQ